MEMVSTITSLITNVVNFAGGLLLLFGAVTLGADLEYHNGPGISRGAWSIGTAHWPAMQILSAPA